MGEPKIRITDYGGNCRDNHDNDDHDSNRYNDYESDDKDNYEDESRW